MGSFKAPFGKVVSGIRPGFIDDIGQDIGAIGRQRLAGDRVFLQTFHKTLVGLAKAVGVLGGAHLGIGAVQHDDLYALGPHHGPHPTPAGMAGGPLFHVGAGDGGGTHLHFATGTDGDTGHLIAIFLLHFFDQVIVGQQLQAVVHRDLDPVFVDVHLVKVVSGRLAFQDDGGIAQASQDLGGLAAGVGFFDGAGQRALTAY
jgi:hypothetical protein